MRSAWRVYACGSAGSSRSLMSCRCRPVLSAEDVRLEIFNSEPRKGDNEIGSGRWRTTYLSYDGLICGGWPQAGAATLAHRPGVFLPLALRTHVPEAHSDRCIYLCEGRTRHEMGECPF
jgi:hypothetical protein